jgi:carboxylesterase
MSVVFDINFRKSEKVNLNSEAGLFLKGRNDAAIILAHGMTGSPQEMKFLAEFLNQRGYSVVCPRLAYHGQPIELLKKAKWQEFYQSIRTKYLEMVNGYKFIFVAGLSMGALLALLLGDEFGDKISAVSCLSPTLFYDGWNTPWYKCFLPLAYITPLKNFFYFKEELPYGIKNKHLQQLMHRYYSKTSLHNTKHLEDYGYPYFPVALFYQLDLLVKYLSKRLQYIKNPVQLIQARNDDITSVKNSQFIYDNIKSREKNLILLDNSYHVITVDEEREKVADNMDVFFKKILLQKN